MLNTLHFGDNLDVLRKHIETESVDLIYLDPPFNSKLSYNVLYKEPTGNSSKAQADAFEDAWHWGPEAAAAFDEIMAGKSSAAGIIRSLRSFLGENDMMAYLVMMTVRLIEMHRALKMTGSLYLHCDATAAHYLKIILDGIFGADRFRSEITWKRTTSHGNVSRNYGAVADHILFYTRGDEYVWNQAYSPFDKEYVEEKFRGKDKNGRRWQSVTLRNPSIRPNLHYPYLASNGQVYQPHANGWSCDIRRMKKYDQEERLHFPGKADGKLRLKMYLDESPGVKAQNIWSDIPAVNAMAEERLGYPTQKPLALLTRIVSTSSNPGDVVLDPFCGCGTAVHAAQALGRQWIGIDVTHIAIQIILDRLKKYFPSEKPEVLGRPEDLSGARELARRDKYQFQWWASSLIGGQARGGNRKGADRGVDGEIFFKHGVRSYGKAIISVKGGDNLAPSMIRDLAGTTDRERADMGIFICLAQPTREMRVTAASFGMFDGVYPKIAIITVDELLQRQSTFSLPPTFDTVTVRDEARQRGPKQRNVDITQLRREPEFIFSIPGGEIIATRKKPAIQSTEIPKHLAKSASKAAAKLRREPEFVLTFTEGERRASSVALHEDVARWGGTSKAHAPSRTKPIAEGHYRAKTRDLPFDEPLLVHERRQPRRKA